MKSGNIAKHGWTRLIGIVCVGLIVCVANAAERYVDYAAEDAAYQTIKSLTDANISTGRIAFLGLFGEHRNIAPVFRAGVVGTPGVYQFYTRNENDWDKLVGEIDFANRRSDVMNSETIQKFGQIHGVDALLYGTIREAAQEVEAGAVVRLAMTLADVETGEILWQRNIMGRYEKPADVGALTKGVRKAAIQAAGNAAADLKQKSARFSEPANVFILPLQGEKGIRITELLVGEMVNASGDKVQFFSLPAEPARQRMMRRIADDLYQDRGITADSEEMQRITRQLEQMFSQNKAGDGGRKNVKAANAVLTGRVTGITREEEQAGAATQVALNLSLRNLLSNKHVWSANMDGKYVDSWEDNFLVQLRQMITPVNIGIGIAILAGALIALLVIKKIGGAVTRPR